MSAADSTSKSAAAFRTISEVSSDLDVPQHVLRFWETKFPQVKPLKRAGRRRYYRPEDIEILRRIRDLLYKDGFTIKGVQKLFRDGGVKNVVESGDVPLAAAVAEKAAVAPVRESAASGDHDLRKLLAELRKIRALLAEENS